MAKKKSVSVDAIKYEAGVLLFNLSGVSEKSLSITNSFDAVGCLTSLMRGAGVEGVDDWEMKIGFIAECENYGMKKEKAEALYQEAFALLEI